MVCFGRDDLDPNGLRKQRKPLHEQRRIRRIGLKQRSRGIVLQDFICRWTGEEGKVQRRGAKVGGKGDCDTRTRADAQVRGVFIVIEIVRCEAAFRKRIHAFRRNGDGFGRRSGWSGIGRFTVACGGGRRIRKVWVIRPCGGEVCQKNGTAQQQQNDTAQHQIVASNPAWEAAVACCKQATPDSPKRIQYLKIMIAGFSRPVKFKEQERRKRMKQTADVPPAMGAGSRQTSAIARPAPSALRRRICECRAAAEGRPLAAVGRRLRENR